MPGKQAAKALIKKALSKLNLKGKQDMLRQMSQEKKRRARKKKT